MLFSALLLISIKSVLILLPINSFYYRITLRFWRIIACPLLLYGAIFGGRRWTVFSTAILIIPCVGSELPCRIRILLLGYLSLSLAMRFCRCELCFEHGQYQFLFPKAKQGSALGINGGLGNLG